MTPEERQEIRERHYPDELADPACLRDWQFWPCDTARLLADYDRLVEVAREVVTWHQKYLDAANGIGHLGRPHDRDLRAMGADSSRVNGDCAACAGAEYGTESEMHDSVYALRALIDPATPEPAADPTCIGCGEADDHQQTCIRGGSLG